MADLVEFLRARLDTDELLARPLLRDSDGPSHAGHAADVPGTLRPNCPDCQTMVSSDRLLAEVEAKRRIIDLEVCVACDVEMQPCDHRDETLRLLALPYADHPDYRQEWRP